ncbi:hypothetical protein [Parasporobacterium paucivorans]|uniref:Uncharacterized protein n=1 Tax=Parasporobacterium paucivorans DSM 15970 TaxID=1122934 RepID=A0A1M6GTY9_9FIRM|nr:hypothetical protein [Parasporobacterium paucivorans]SHJ13310.1 hypothetical protein SAMN02745691_01387 [Parasporobacterium paucivorans DSM 15970]
MKRLRLRKSILALGLCAVIAFTPSGSIFASEPVDETGNGSVSQDIVGSPG